MLNLVIRWSLNNRIFVISFAAMLVVYGGFVIVQLPVDVFPDLNRPVVTVMTEAPGLAPEEVETLVTIPLETAVNGLPGVQRVRSTSGVGLSIVFVEFDWDTDIYRNRQFVSERLQLVREKIPPGLLPTMGSISSIMGEIQLVGLHSPGKSVRPEELRTLAEWTIRPRLLSIPGISQINNMGGGLKQFQVLLSADKLKTRQLSLTEVSDSLTHISLNSTGGYIDLDGKEHLIRNIGQARTIEEIEGSVVGMHLGRPVLVKDVAQVRTGAQSKRGDASVNAQPAVIMTVQKQPGANTLQLTANLEQALNEIEKQLPADVKLERNLFRQSDFIRSAIQNVEEALRDGAILVALVLFLFLANLRTTAITLTAIPLSFVITAIVFKFFGLSINTMTIGGLAIAIGELVDDAIVDTENVFRRLRENTLLAVPRSVLRVVYEASSEVRNSIVLATVIVVLVFIPLFYMGGIEGRLFVPLGIAYIVSLVASLVVSLTVTPALCAMLFAKMPAAKNGVHLDSRFVIWLKKIDLRVLHRTIDHPKVLIVLGATILVLCLASIPYLGREFLPKFNEGTATVSVILSPGVSLEVSNNVGRQAEEIILSVPEVKNVSRRTGRAEMDEHAEGVHSSELDVDFKEGGRSRPTVLNEIREKLESLEGAFVSVGQPISHRLDHLLSGVRAGIAIKIFGTSLTSLRAKAAEVFQSMKDVPGLVDLQIEQQVLIPQVKIQILRESAAVYGISSGEVVETLQKSLNGQVVGQIIDKQKFFDIFMRFDDQSRANIELIKKTVLKIMPDARRVSVADVADVFIAEGPNLINRENLQRRIVISGNTSGRDLAAVAADIESRLQTTIKFPSDMRYSLGGQFESQKSAQQLLMILGLFSILGIFMVLYFHFRSGFIAFQIMLNIPMALVGGIIAIWISDRTLSVASLVAFITLCGIASRNGIMMISHYLHLLEHEQELFSRQMVIRGSLERLVPVLMTALTAGLALLPLVLSQGASGKEILHPVAVVIFGGLFSSTLLDMVLTPSIFLNFGKRSAEKYLAFKKTGKELI